MAEKITKNDWAVNLSSVLPYVKWSGLSASERYCWNIKWHNHAMYELHVILDGSCNVRIGEESFDLGQGCAVLIAPNISHSASVTASPFCRFSVSFTAVDPLLASLSENHPNGYSGFYADPNLLALCHKILEEIDTTSYMGIEMTSILLSEFLISSIRLIKSTPTVPRAALDSLAVADEIELIDAFFVRTPFEQQTRQKLASYLHCSERQLNRKFQRLFGLSFQQKRLVFRMEYAKHLLSTTDASINEIGCSIGYTDPATFYRAFKNCTGTTPFQYRLTHKQS